MFKVVITKTEENVPVVRKEWKKVVEQPDDKHDEIYRYVNNETTETQTHDIYEQTVDNLDITKVIKAINGIE